MTGPRRVVLTVLAAGIPLVLSGCASILDLFGSQRIYGGVQGDVELIERPYLPSAHNQVYFFPLLLFGIIDLPLSAVMDTVLVPVTVTMALTRSEPAQKPPEQIRREALEVLERTESVPSREIAIAQLSGFLLEPGYEPVLAAFIRVARAPGTPQTMRTSLLYRLVWAPHPEGFDAALEILTEQRQDLDRYAVTVLSTIAHDPQRYCEALRRSMEKIRPSKDDAARRRDDEQIVLPRRLKLLKLAETLENGDRPALVKTRKQLQIPWKAGR